MVEVWVKFDDGREEIVKYVTQNAGGYNIGKWTKQDESVYLITKQDEFFILINHYSNTGLSIHFVIHYGKTIISY